MTAKKTTRSQPTDADNDGSNLAVRLSTRLSSIFDGFTPFDELFFQPLVQGSNSKMSELGGFRQPILDVQDRGDHFSVTAELPGFTKDEVQVKVDADGIELRADKSEKEGKSENGTYQRSTRSYYRYLSLPEQVLSEKIDGTMKNGILQLKLPKRASKLEETTRRVDLK
jgi:HSP20 family protein